MPPSSREDLSKNRIVGYDLARALAVFGMVVVNFKIVMGAERHGPDWLVSLVGLIDGRAAATFVVLAGAGLSLLSSKGRTQNDSVLLARDRRTLLKRAAFLFVVGSLYTSIWPADILHFYGVYLAGAAFLLAAPTRRLWAVAGSLVLAFGVMLFVLDYEKGWDWSNLSYEGLWTPVGMVRHVFFNGFHPVVPWLAFVLLGMILGRQNMASPAVRRRVFAWGAGVAVAAELMSWLLINALVSVASPSEGQNIRAVFGTGPMPPMPLYMIAGAGTACAVIAASISLGERCGDSVWLRPFVATGQLALTLYVGHVVIGMGTLEACGRLENQTLPFAVSASAFFCVAGVIFAHAWRRKFRRGPIEAVMRAWTGPKTRSS
ncbi:MAG: DUF418 domain-containing protein [Phycisphaerae bacterium]